MLPTILVGSIIGVFANISLPAVVLQICLTLLLVFLTFDSYKKAGKIYKRESVYMADTRLQSVLVIPKEKKGEDKKITRSHSQ